MAISEAVVSPERRERRVVRIWDCGGETEAASEVVAGEEEAAYEIVLELWNRRRGRRERERGGCNVDNIAGREYSNRV